MAKWMIIEWEWSFVVWNNWLETKSFWWSTIVQKMTAVLPVVHRFEISKRNHLVRHLIVCRDRPLDRLRHPSDLRWHRDERDDRTPHHSSTMSWTIGYFLAGIETPFRTGRSFVLRNRDVILSAIVPGRYLLSRKKNINRSQSQFGFGRVEKPSIIESQRRKKENKQNKTAQSGKEAIGNVHRLWLSVVVSLLDNETSCQMTNNRSVDQYHWDRESSHRFFLWFASWCCFYFLFVLFLFRGVFLFFMHLIWFKQIVQFGQTPTWPTFIHFRSGLFCARSFLDFQFNSLLCLIVFLFLLLLLLLFRFQGIIEENETLIDLFVDWLIYYKKATSRRPRWFVSTREIVESYRAIVRGRVNWQWSK